MSGYMKAIFLAAAIITASLLIAWLATGRHYYTKYQVVESVRAPVDPDDPLAGTGFYDEESRIETVTKQEFHLGLLPTPQGLLDKHGLSVISILIPTWFCALALAWWLRRRRRAAIPVEQNQEKIA